VVGERWILRDLEGNCDGVTEVLSRHLPGWIEENAGYPLSRDSNRVPPKYKYKKRSRYTSPVGDTSFVQSIYGCDLNDFLEELPESFVSPFQLPRKGTPHSFSFIEEGRSFFLLLKYTKLTMNAYSSHALRFCLNRLNTSLPEYLSTRSRTEHNNSYR
jgi:hypothetical protein